MAGVIVSHSEYDVECEVCLKEIPYSEVGIVEADDYVMYFCGLDCYRQWRKASPDKRA